MKLRSLSCLLAITLGLSLACKKEPEQPRFRIVQVDSAEGKALTGKTGDDTNPEHGAEISAAARFADAASKNLDELLPPAKGNTFFLRPRRGEVASDGSREQPWASLEEAVPQLGPGDRLVVLPGRYRGPILLGDHKSTVPIEIVARTDAVFSSAEDEKAPVITIDGGAWTLIGLEIKPGASSAAVVFSANARNATLRQAHIHSGDLDGVVIRAGAKDVAVLDTHIHHLAYTDGAAGIRIEQGATDLQILKNKIHGLRGETILLFEPGKYELLAQGRSGSRQLTLPDVDIQIIEALWEP